MVAAFYFVDHLSRYLLGVLRARWRDPGITFALTLAPLGFARGPRLWFLLPDRLEFHRPSGLAASSYPPAASSNMQTAIIASPKSSCSTRAFVDALPRLWLAGRNWTHTASFHALGDPGLFCSTQPGCGFYSNPMQMRGMLDVLMHALHCLCALALLAMPLFADGGAVLSRQESGPLHDHRVRCAGSTARRAPRPYRPGSKRATRSRTCPGCERFHSAGQRFSNRVAAATRSQAQNKPSVRHYTPPSAARHMEVYGLSSEAPSGQAAISGIPSWAACPTAEILLVLCGDSNGADRDLRSAPVAGREGQTLPREGSFLRRVENRRSRPGAAKRSVPPVRSRAPADPGKTSTPTVSRVAAATRSSSDSNRARRTRSSRGKRAPGMLRVVNTSDVPPPFARRGGGSFFYGYSKKKRVKFRRSSSGSIKLQDRSGRKWWQPHRRR